MINLKKHDNVADAVKDILQQEALKGNQDKIDANHNGKIDGEDFKILRGKKKVEEELKGNQKKIDKNHNGKIDGQDFKILRGEKKVEEEIDMDDRTKDTLVGREKTKQKDDVGPNSNAKVSKFKLKSEEAEQIDELSKDTLGSYLDKKKSEYMKGKTQSGSKENAKDIQNMGKAHDKMKKEETQFNDHEKGAAQRLRDMVKNEKEAEKRDKQYQAMRNKKTLKQMKERMEEPILDELINEVLAKDASAGDWIHDFVHSDNPKFAGKSTAKRKEMALAAYYSKKNEEAVNEGLKDMAKKSFKALTGGSDKDHLDRLKKDMYGGSEVKYAAKTLVKHAKDPLGLKKEEVEQIDEKVISSELQTIQGNHVVNSQTHTHPDAKHGVSRDTLVHKGTISSKGGSNKKKFEIHNHPNHGLVFKTNHTDDEKQSIKKHLIYNKMAGKGTAIHEEVEHLDEGKMDKMTLSGLWHKHAQHSYSSDQGYGHGDNNPRLNDHAATAIENHVRKHHGNKVADDMVSHSDHYTAYHEYAGPKEAPHHEKEMGKLKKKHGIHDEKLHEGWDDMVKAAQEKVKSGPQPNGGSGKKQGSAYGGSKQKDKPEQEVKEAKNPMMDAGVGAEPNFSTDASKPMKVAQTMAKKSLTRMRSEMMGKSGK
jgi:hypothetical protein